MSVGDELTEREPGVVVAPAFRADHSRKAKSMNGKLHTWINGS